MGFKTSYITTIQYSLLAIAAISFLVFEWFQLDEELDRPKIEQQAILAVEESFDRLQNQIFEFSSNSTEFANQVSTLIETNGNLSSTSSLNDRFWGAAVFDEGKPIYWNGYIPTGTLDSLSAINSDLSLERKRNSNVQFLESIIPIVNIEGSDTSYVQVYTRLLLEQENEFAIGTSQNTSLHNDLSTRTSFPVRVSYSRVRQDSVIHSKEFESVSGDFIALVYAYEADIDNFIAQKDHRIRDIRSYFILGIVVLFSILIVWVSRSIHPYLQLILQWIFLGLLFFLQNPISSQHFESILTIKMLEVIFLLLGYLSFQRFLQIRTRSIKKKYSSEKYFLNALNGFVITLLWIFILGGIFQAIEISELNLFNQVLTSSILSTIWLWIIGSSLLVILTLFSSNFLSELHENPGSATVLYGFTFFGIALPLFFYSLLVDDITIHEAVAWVTGIVFLSVLTLTFLQFKFTILNPHVSLIRVLLVILTIVACSKTAIIYSSFDEVLFTKLEENSKEFEHDNEDKIREVISELLNEAYTDVRSISLFSVSNFEQIIGNLIQEDWLKYSFSLQLIDKNGSPLAAYNTNLSVPQWTTDFRIDELIIPYEEERIRKDNIRPILRNQPINTVNAEYSYFMRGWIPVYQSRRSEEISGWILATLYQEIPELNRPFRSVVNATIQSPEETAFTFTEYEAGIPTRSIVRGTLTSIPDYGVLPTPLKDYLSENYEWVQKSTMQNMQLKERFHQTESGTIVRGAHQQIAMPQILYIFLRIYFTVAIPLILVLVVITSTRVWNMFSESRKIRDRIMDRSIIASIACLFLLIGATSLILESQNRTEVQEALRDQLITLTETLSEADESDQLSNDFLENITAVLGVDASLYTEGRLVNSTTPPIYNQHLLPPTIPWGVYQQIVSGGAQLAVDILTIDDQELMIGYQPWLNADNQIAGIVAIPTFLKTPDFYSRLLATTSYLLAFYSLIFAVLILSIGFISTRITAPLEVLEAGLEKISAGDLETRLKVHSNDEIGMLTKAYNSMAIRLKTLQDELAQSEREAAWKQMAQQVAHEIKNPLTPMKLNLQHLERQLHQTGEELSLDKPRVSAITKSMIDQIEALNKIASDFSKFAKPTSQQFEDVKINELISSVVMMYEEDQINITTEFDNREFIISGVSDELRRVLVNLIKNAQEAIDANGKINLQTNWNKRNKSVEIFISDDGKGISKEEATSIFLPNFSTKTSGTGLGLAITKKIIEEHTGSITFESKINEGTTFRISLPLKNS